MLAIENDTHYLNVWIHVIVSEGFNCFDDLLFALRIGRDERKDPFAAYFRLGIDAVLDSMIHLAAHDHQDRYDIFGFDKDHEDEYKESWMREDGHQRDSNVNRQDGESEKESLQTQFPR